ncbi:SPEF1 family protein [Toxoplasma gondii TgCatPRC2]|uniref:SPEF1 family protein n=14 Tax=Toxoplasma gondii TaxID=5811 RepID=A0A125YTQ6_TOXGV|nr:SPEF1 family protein [Toxoplasma gondii ME49]EPR63092.1 SPEF1 family protein [Toxoplasma gondii GT1]ESS35449.1 SPEF1 family protein [Toxoplasma gondii VEG]KFG31183.1 SPEF1 family protein [Toxoplasma gondii GAB2-2007-GAL-DOM2]KFG37119.1 SPEF1 family protein [Toxoplasma gondii FOU]KFG50495.1 SPEF1 family protein [Toxoplasma gondii p89]KFG57615.1 SPEF1 family protein [Toxoplasma gondii RUB]KFH01606.1 SPEF1 family protein [Toxoplasma gondii MAS]KFH02859.1 SPEF1 family protein [Toxoplasma gon|eukprot:XP_018636947.1 SPEF1 family protein [Toxoplasma gondii ME49]
MASSASLHASFPKGASKSCVPLAPPLPGDEELAELYHWVDTIPLSRPKRNISRDFSDGVLMAELVNSCLPKMAELHNYSSANSIDKKAYNWQTLNRKVFHRLGMRLNPKDIDDIVNARPGAVERVISLFRKQVMRQTLTRTQQLIA